jgi:ribonuclease HI
MSKKKYYAVVKGHRPGIYDLWSGERGAEVQVKGFNGALYKGFASLADAKEWFAAQTVGKKPTLYIRTADSKPIDGNERPVIPESGQVVIYTDGGCIGNPGPGGYGAVMLFGEKRRELSGGYRLTTNNRMELTACISALRELKSSSSVLLYSDSKYVVDGMKKGWAKRWRANRWMRNKRERVENSDLWSQLLQLCEKYEVAFHWVTGHAGHPENERCDKLSKQAARRKNLPPDVEFERLQREQPTLLL